MASMEIIFTIECSAKESEAIEYAKFFLPILAKTFIDFLDPVHISKNAMHALGVLETCEIIYSKRIESLSCHQQILRHCFPHFNVFNSNDFYTQRTATGISLHAEMPYTENDADHQVSAIEALATFNPNYLLFIAALLKSVNATAPSFTFNIPYKNSNLITNT